MFSLVKDNGWITFFSVAFSVFVLLLFNMGDLLGGFTWERAECGDGLLHRSWNLASTAAMGL